MSKVNEQKTPSLQFCPYCGEKSLKFVKSVPRCTKCKAVFHAYFSRYARKSPKVTSVVCENLTDHNEWRPYDFISHKPDFPMMEIVEFLAGQDAPSGLFKKGDIVQTSPLIMNTSLFTHWRPIPK